MSIALMTLAWKTDLPSGRKMVLLALCDNANDQGECFPSVSMIAQKCSMGQSTVKAHLADLERSGVIRKEMRTGRSTIYHLDPARFQTSPKSGPSQNPATTQPESGWGGSQNSDDTQPKSGPITTIESSVEPPKESSEPAKPTPFEPMTFMLENGVDGETAKDWLQHRKTKKASTSATVLKDRIKQAGIAGISLGDALSLEVSRNWQGFEAGWLQPKQQARASPAYQTKQEQAKNFLNELTGNRNEQRTPPADIIDIDTRTIAD